MSYGPSTSTQTRSRSEGRMVSHQDAVNEPNLDMLITASLKSGFKPEIEREKKHPKTWHQEEASGRILVAKTGLQIRRLKENRRLHEGKIQEEEPLI